MKNPLSKRSLRELKDDIGKYVALFLFLTLMIGFVSGFLVAEVSMKTAYDEGFEKYNIEDGHFTLAVKADQSLIDTLEKENLSVYPLFYKNFDFGNSHSVRVYKVRTDINLSCLMQGDMPKSDSDIVIDRLYAQNNKITIGDTIVIDSKSFTVKGLVALSDYSALFKNNTDMMFDANKFTVACVTDSAFNKLDNSKLNYNYAWIENDSSMTEKEKSDKADNIKAILTKTGMITDFLKASDNQAITFTGEDMGGDHVMMVTFLYIVITVLAFIFGITTRNTIEKESGTIGTLRASGYTRGELLRHYMVLPVLVTAFAAIVGNILGYTLLKKVVVDMYYGSYSLPTYVTLWNGEAFIETTLIPCVIVFVVVLLVLYMSLRLSPLQFLRHELAVKKKNSPAKLKHFKFFTRYRLRVVFQNMPSYITLFLGVTFASVLLLFGMMMTPLLKSFKEDVIESKLANYQYILKIPVETKADDAEKYSVVSLETESGEEITVYGIDQDSKYLNIDIDEGKAVFSDGFIEKYGLKNSDEVTLNEKFGEKSYTFVVDSGYHYPATLSVFMNRSDFNKMFDKDTDYFCGYFSNKKLSDINEKYVATIITQSDLTVIADQLEDSIGKMFYLMCGFSATLYILLIYLLAKQVIEKNSQSISMIKILGYNNKEITSIYNLSTGIAMAVSLLLSLPISYYLIKVIYYIMMKEFKGWLTFYVAPWIWPLMVLIGALCYTVVHFIQMRRIGKIPMGNALKNIE